MPATSLLLPLICQLGVLQLDSFFFQTLLLHPTASPRTPTPQTHTRTSTPTPPFPSFEGEGMERCLIYNEGGNALSPSPPLPPLTVTVWTLMKKRWVLSCAPIYLSGQGTCTLIPASLTLLSHTYPVIISIMMQCYNRNIIITSLTKMAVFFDRLCKLDW